jgi:hypothetical protein
MMVQLPQAPAMVKKAHALQVCAAMGEDSL